MTVLHIFILASIAFIIGRIKHPRLRAYFILLANLFTIYWFQQSATTLFNISFWLPTATIVLVIISWAVTSPPEIKTLRNNWDSLLLILLTVLAIDLTRILGSENNLFGELALPRPAVVLFAVGAFFLLVVLILRLTKLRKLFLSGVVFLIIVAFIIIKLPALNALITKEISPVPKETLTWLGFSYFAFRILHTLRDRQNGKLISASLSEYVIYVTFFPAFMAGPIDRIDRFLGDLRKPRPLTDKAWTEAGIRFFSGLFKKFVIADALARFALNASIAPYISSTGLFWLSLYAYTFQIYFDFSGYTDIAIGMAHLLGIKLPENFERPYLKPNLTQFWNAWHITLTQWFRAYFFNPMQRFLRTTAKKMPVWAIILLLQITTMILIGLWHGIMPNFILWGTWHGLGLFIHNRWRAKFGPKIAQMLNTPKKQKNASFLGIVLTFHYVALGWTFFVLPVAQIPAALKLMVGI